MRTNQVLHELHFIGLNRSLDPGCNDLLRWLGATIAPPNQLPEPLIDRGGLVITLLSLATVVLLKQEDALSVQVFERLRLGVTFVWRRDTPPEPTLNDLVRLLL